MVRLRGVVPVVEFLDCRGDAGDKGLAGLMAGRLDVVAQPGIPGLPQGVGVAQVAQVQWPAVGGVAGHRSPPFLAAFSGAGVPLRIAEEIWPRANGIGLVRAGLGATFMTPSEAQHLPPEVTFRALRGPAPESRLVLGWRQATSLEPALAAFLSVAGPGAGEFGT